MGVAPLWAELCPPRQIRVLTPSPQDLGTRLCSEVVGEVSCVWDLLHTVRSLRE